MELRRGVVQDRGLFGVAEMRNRVPERRV